MNLPLTAVEADKQGQRLKQVVWVPAIGNELAIIPALLTIPCFLPGFVPLLMLLYVYYRRRSFKPNRHWPNISPDVSLYRTPALVFQHIDSQGRKVFRVQKTS